MLIERRQDRPDSILGRSHLFRPAQAPRKNRPENSCTNPARNHDMTREILKLVGGENLNFAVPSPLGDPPALPGILTCLLPRLIEFVCVEVASERE